MRKPLSSSHSARKYAKRLSARLRAVTMQLRAALAENRRLSDENRRLRLELHQDPMTGMLNRAGLRAEWHRQHRNVFAVCVIDGDRVKRINDTYGHEVGDVAIIRIGRELRTSSVTGDGSERRVDRTGVTVARTGGDEYVMLVTRDAATDAAELAALLLGISRDVSRPDTEINSHAVRLRVSIGAAIVGVSATDDVDTLRGLSTDRADQLLYAGKRGRETDAIVNIDATDDHGAIVIGAYTGKTQWQ